MTTQLLDDVLFLDSGSSENSSQQGLWIILKNGDLWKKILLLNFMWQRVTVEISETDISIPAQIKPKQCARLDMMSGKSENNIFCNLGEQTLQTDVKG